VCQTHPQSERWAAANLRQAGYRVFLPQHVVIRRDPVLRTMTRQVTVPLFTSYLFVHLHANDPWAPVWYSPGVARMLGSEWGKPHPCPDGAVEALEATQELRASIPRPDASWAPGTPCRLATGSLKDHEGVVLAVNRLTATVGLLLFGQMREVSVPVSSLAPRNAE